MSRRFFLLLLLAAILHLSIAPRATAQQVPIRVACVGDSITFGSGIPNRAQDSYPAQLQQLLGTGYEVRNFGVSGATLLRQGDKPYWKQPAYAQAQAFKPDVVVIKLGTNDSKPQNWKFKNEFAADAQALVASFRALPSRPRVLLCLPVPAYRVNFGINGDIILKEQIPLLRQAAYATASELVDLQTPFLDKGAWFADGIHPGAAGAGYMAKNICEVIKIKPDSAFDIEKTLAAQDIKTSVTNYQGYRCLAFKVDGRACKIVQPRVTAAGRPILWVAEFFGTLPQVELALAQRGWHVVTCDVMGLLGSPVAMGHWEKFHDVLVKAGLGGKFTLLGISRGGLYSYNWAVLHPGTVACLYGDAPVCDFKSWPGGKGKSNAPSKPDWDAVIRYYGFKDEAAALAFKKNPVDNLAPLAQAGIPIIHVVGQADRVVPVEENTDLVEQRYKALGGTIQVIRKPGVDHHPHGLANPQPVLDFILAHGIQK